MKRIVLALAAFLLAAPAGAQTPAPAAPEPSQQALIQMLQEAQNREAIALVHAYTAKAKLAEAEKLLADRNKPATDAPAAPAPAK